LEAPNQRSSQVASRKSSRMDRAAAATERRQVGRRKGTRKSKQLLTSEDLAEKAPRKALKRGREVEKIMVRLWVLGVSTTALRAIQIACALLLNQYEKPNWPAHYR